MTVPPEALRMGMGPFADAAHFLDSGRATLELAKRLTKLSPSDSVLDVGCGCGRVALPLREYLGVKGRYEGFDADAACITWCQQHIGSFDERFAFTAVDVASASYNPQGSRNPATVSFPYADGGFDCAILSSILTHLEEAGIERYVEEVGRVLRPDGRALMSIFLLNPQSRLSMMESKTPFVFTHQIGPTSWALDATTPTEGVAVDEQWFRTVLERHGFQLEQTLYGDWSRVPTWEAQHDWMAVRRGQ